MKTLYLVRHAKSSWSFRQLDDFSRPLGVRGRKDVIKMGKFLSKHTPCPEQLITSPASRAFHTCLFLADKWRYPEERIELEPALYHADEDEILEVIRSSGDAQTLAIFGHNPGFTDIANELTGDYIDNVPTCGVVGVEFEIDTWQQVGQSTGKQLFFHYPKGINE